MTRLPFGLDGYKSVTPASGHKSSLLDYQHIGHLVQLQNERNINHPTVEGGGESQPNRITKLLHKIQAPLRWTRSASKFLVGSFTSHSAAKYNANLFVCSPNAPVQDTETAVQDTEIAVRNS